MSSYEAQQTHPTSEGPGDASYDLSNVKLDSWTNDRIEFTYTREGVIASDAQPAPFAGCVGVIALVSIGIGGAKQGFVRFGWLFFGVSALLIALSTLPGILRERRRNREALESAERMRGTFRLAVDRRARTCEIVAPDSTVIARVAFDNVSLYWQDPSDSYLSASDWRRLLLLVDSTIVFEGPFVLIEGSHSNAEVQKMYRRARRFLGMTDAGHPRPSLDSD